MGNPDGLHQRLQLCGVMVLTDGKAGSERHPASVTNKMDFVRRLASRVARELDQRGQGIFLY